MTIETNSIVSYYVQLKSVKAASKAAGVSEATARKVLLSAGLIRTKHSVAIRDLRALGWSIDQIADSLGISRKAVLAHMPYSKGRYGDTPTVNALRIRRFRARRKDNT